MGKYTTEWYISSLDDSLKEEYEVLGEYTKCHESIKVKHKICGNVYDAPDANDFKRHKANCPKCGAINRIINRSNTQEDFENKVFELTGDEYTVIGDYINEHRDIEMRHNTCGEEFECTPSNFIYPASGRTIGTRCPKCSEISRRKNKTTDPKEFRKEFEKISKGEYELLSEYTKIKEPITVKHVLCGAEYPIIANRFINGDRCNCLFSSKAEDKIRNWLTENSFNFIAEKRFEDCRDKHTLPFDFFLPNLNICIEYDGIQHYKPIDFGCKDKEKVEKKFKTIQKHDQIKNEYCRNNEIRLIRIPYTEFDSLERILEEELKEN